jgi:hypothetical protein
MKVFLIGGTVFSALGVLVCVLTLFNIYSNGDGGSGVVFFTTLGALNAAFFFMGLVNLADYED